MAKRMRGSEWWAFGFRDLSVFKLNYGIHYNMSGSYKDLPIYPQAEGAEQWYAVIEEQGGEIRGYPVRLWNVFNDGGKLQFTGMVLTPSGYHRADTHSGFMGYQVGSMIVLLDVRVSAVIDTRVNDDSDS